MRLSGRLHGWRRIFRLPKRLLCWQASTLSNLSAMFRRGYSRALFSWYLWVWWYNVWSHLRWWSCRCLFWFHPIGYERGRFWCWSYLLFPWYRESVFLGWGSDNGPIPWIRICRFGLQEGDRFIPAQWDSVSPTPKTVKEACAWFILWSLAVPASLQAGLTGLWVWLCWFRPPRWYLPWWVTSWYRMLAMCCYRSLRRGYLPAKGRVWTVSFWNPIPAIARRYGWFWFLLIKGILPPRHVRRRGYWSWWRW